MSNSASAADIKAKLAKLKKDKEQREIDRKIKEDQDAKNKSSLSASNVLIK